MTLARCRELFATYDTSGATELSGWGTAPVEEHYGGVCLHVPASNTVSFLVGFGAVSSVCTNPATPCFCDPPLAGGTTLTHSYTVAGALSDANGVAYAAALRNDADYSDVVLLVSSSSPLITLSSATSSVAVTLKFPAGSTGCAALRADLVATSQASDLGTAVAR